jgi:hypothetical protein
MSLYELQIYPRDAIISMPFIANPASQLRIVYAAETNSKSAYSGQKIIFLL